MNWLQFVDSMVGHLIWPIVVLVIAFAVRKHLGSLAERVLELSFGGATVKFGQLLSKGTEIIEKAHDRPPSALSLSEPDLPFGEKIGEPPVYDPWSIPAANLNRFLEMTTSQTLSIRNVFGAFDHVERALDAVGDALEVKVRGAMLMEMLWRREFVPREMIDLYRSLREARNAIAHGQADMPNEAESFEFVRQAEYLHTLLVSALDKIKAEKK